MTRRGEFDLIADLFAPLAAKEPGAFALTDDAAVLDIAPGHQVVTTVDAIVAGVHFLPDDPPESIARKLMRVNLSDLAAMGATPRAVFITCAFPKTTTEEWIVSFARGLAEDVARFSVPVAGGDTVSTSGPASFTLTALGTVAAGRAVRRTGARAGDLLAVSGSIGDGALGLLAAQGQLLIAPEHGAFLADRYRIPQPRLDVAAALAGSMRACMDISDGLVQDLGHVCRASGVGAMVEMAGIPLSAAARACLDAGIATPDLLFAGGDDYELLMAIAPDALPAVQAWTGTPVTVIGRFTEAPEIVWRQGDGRPWVPARTGFTHF